MGALSRLPLNKPASAEPRFAAHPVGQDWRCTQIPDFTPTVFVVDDDKSLRASLRQLIRSAGWEPKTFASAAEFLAGPPAVVPNCLVLELSLPGFDGLELQKRLAIERPYMPVIFITDRGDVYSTVRAMKAGAVEFLIKPLSCEVLLCAIQEGLERSREALDWLSEIEPLRACYSSLSPREREVMALVVSGRLNKQAAGELGISEITIKAHRGNVMRKMKANSLPDLVRMAAKLRLAPVAVS
jgi:FixJ family two-component response regulator